MTAEIVGRVARSLELPIVDSGQGVWSMAAERRNSYRVSLHIWPEETLVHSAAGSQLAIDRDYIPRELALVLLEENHRVLEGSFRLAVQDSLCLALAIGCCYFLTFP